MGIIENRYEGIDKYAIWFIKRKAKQLVGQAGFTESDREDLEQELIYDLLRHLPKFDPDRATRNTFIARVVEFKVVTIIRAQKAGIRDHRLNAYSLNESVEDGDGNRISHIETINQDNYFLKMGKYSRPLEELGELSIDIEQVLAELPPDLSNLCEQLIQGWTVTDISRNAGISRETVYKSIKKLREMLNFTGFEDYF